jgi:predicted RNase H-like nuclease (RuvC/YqgF family)
MSYSRLKFFAQAVGTVAGVLACSFVFAQSVDQAIDADQDKIQEAVQSQQRVTAIADQTDQIVQDYKQVLKQIENLRVYNAQLELQISDQRQQLTDLAQSIDEATSMEVNLVPLQLQMVDALSQFVEMDLPFSLEERRTRVDRLSSNMERSDLTTAEKFRQILEAYRIETDYGRNIENYSDTIDVNGVDLEVDVLRVGRIALMYQTKDQAITGAWNSTTQQWEELPAGQYRSAVAAGLRIARQQAAIDIMTLPITAPKG